MAVLLEVVPGHSGTADYIDLYGLLDSLFNRFSLPPQYQHGSLCHLDSLALPAEISFQLAEPSAAILAFRCGFVVWRV